jgi:hypothetical protein
MPDEPEPNPIREVDVLELVRMREQLEESGALNQRVKEATEKELGRIAREHYPGMNTYWQAEQFRRLQEHISFLATLNWEELAKLDSQARKSLSEPEGK